MKEWKQFMVVHRDPSIPWEKVEENWGRLANVESAKWVRTYFNREKGVRYCIWLAPSSDQLANVFRDIEVSFESILDVAFNPGSLPGYHGGYDPLPLQRQFPRRIILHGTPVNGAGGLQPFLRLWVCGNQRQDGDDQ